MFSTHQILLLSSLFCIVMTRHLDFRERFLERKRLRTLKDQRIKVLNKFVLKNTEILDDITHYRKVKGKSLKASKKVRAIEKDFRRLIAMDGMKYNYKRDMFWRTWRTMPPVNNATDQIVSYKCNNPVFANATEYQNCGMWTIEDKSPPCPFEFFSLISADKLCGADYKQYKDVNSACPSIIKFSDMTATCDNPIETQWHFTKMYGVDQKYNDVICKNKDVCDILTLYEISPKHVVFRIINETNDVIYSRIMKPKNRNYICVKDCGRFNPNTRKVTKVDKPLKMDLLVKRKKKKANSHKRMKDKVAKRNALNEMNEPVTNRNVLNDMNEPITKRNVLNDVNESGTKRNVLNKSGTKRKVLNDVNESGTNINVSNEMNELVTKTNVLNKSGTEKNVSNKSGTKRKVLNGRSTKIYVLNDMNESGTTINVSNEMNELVTKINVLNKSGTKRNVLNKRGTKRNALIESGPKINVLNDVNESGTNINVSNEINELVTKRNVLNESGTKRNILNESVTKKNVLNDVNENGSKRNVMDELNEIGTKINVLNDLDESGTKINVLNDEDESATKGGVFLEDISVSVNKRDVSNENNINNDDMNGTGTKEESKEVLNEEVQELSSQNDYIIVSIEENALHNIKPRRKKKQNMDVSKEEVTLRPTVTPGHNLQEVGPISIEELEEEEFE